MSRPVAFLVAALLMSAAAAAQPPAIQLPFGFGPLDPNAPRGPDPFAGRTGAARQKLLEEYGGTAATERAVALGLEWLAKQQKKDGSWAFDGDARAETMAATGMALLAFLGAGETHKASKKYQKTIDAGLKFLVKSCPLNGANPGKFAGMPSQQAYSQAIAALALCEAYGMTKDKALLPSAQAAIDFIQKAQSKNGSWGYKPGDLGDTSITGWQVQALLAARAGKELKVSDKVIKTTIDFLDSAAGGPRKAVYGYKDKSGATAGTSLTAVGLWCRHHIDGWGPDHAGMVEGVEGLMGKAPRPNNQRVPPDMYFCYYATQVVRNFGGDEWATWNEGPKTADGGRKGGVRDALVVSQITKDGGNQGSWEPDNSFIGRYCGRVGTTAMCVLTLEVYYRAPIAVRQPKPEEKPKDR